MQSEQNESDIQDRRRPGHVVVPLRLAAGPTFLRTQLLATIGRLAAVAALLPIPLLPIMKFKVPCTEEAWAKSS